MISVHYAATAKPRRCVPYALARQLHLPEAMRTLLSTALLMTAALNVAAQSFEVGAIGGVSVTDPNVYRTGESKRYLIGPSIEARFFDGRVGIELDAIYRRFGESFAAEFGPPPPEYVGPPALTRYYLRTRTNSWEFPLIGKYYFRNRGAHLRPFVGTGYVLGVQWRKLESTTHVVGESSGRKQSESRTYGPGIGAMAVIGAEVGKWNRLSFQPQARYTRWAGSGSYNRVVNQIDVGLGFRF